MSDSIVNNVRISNKFFIFEIRTWWKVPPHLLCIDLVSRFSLHEESLERPVKKEFQKWKPCLSIRSIKNEIKRFLWWFPFLWIKHDSSIVKPVFFVNVFALNGVNHMFNLFNKVLLPLQTTPTLHFQRQQWLSKSLSPFQLFNPQVKGLVFCYGKCH